MAKTSDTQQTNTAQDEDKKQQKKQEKRKEKLILKIEETRKEVQKAEKKFAKAQSNLEASQSLLCKLEEGLVQIREKPESPAATAPVEQSYEHPEEIRVPDQGESYEDREVVEELHQSSLPPVEGRSDILTNNDGSTAAIPSSETETDQSGSSGSTVESSPQS